MSADPCLDLILALERRLSACDHEMSRDIAARLRDATQARSEIRDDSDGIRIAGCHVLPALIEAIGETELREVFEAAAGRLPWAETPRDIAPDDYRDNHTFVELVGPDGVLRADGFRLGLFALGPDVFYPSHAHNAEELFLVVSGLGAWQLDDGAFVDRAPGDHVLIPADRPHATETGTSGVMAIWAWRGEIDRESYRFV